MDPQEAVKGPHHLVSLEAQNVKRLSAVAITFGGAAIAQIVGRNEQGKSSLMDAFRWCVEGTRAIQSVPVRKGADFATVKLDFGKIVVEKKLQPVEGGGFRPTLVVHTADGIKLPSPQAVLDAWLGPLTMDPLALVSAEPRDRADMVKALVPGVDFAALERANKQDFERRTQVGRDHARERGAAAAITVPDDTPDEIVDISSLTEEYREAHAHNEALKDAQKRYAEAAELRRRANELVDEADAIIRQEKDSRYGTMVTDLDAIKARGQAAQATNTAVEQKRRKRTHEEAAADAARKYEDLTELIEARERQISDAIASAKLPVTGLSFSESDLLLDALPFDQASTARQIEVAVALSMAMNPDLRVIRIKDGEKLDDEHMLLIEKLAIEAGYLILMERVKPADGIGMVVEIEGGEVKSIKPSSTTKRAKR